MDIFNGVDQLFNFKYSGKTQIHLNFVGLKHWKTRILSREYFDQNLWIYGDKTKSLTGNLFIKHIGSPANVIMNKKSMKFNGFSFIECQISQLSMDLRVASKILVDFTPNNSEFICNCTNSSVVLQNINNHTLVNNGIISVIPDITHYSSTLFVAGRSKLSLTSNITLELIQGCLNSTENSENPTIFFQNHVQKYGKFDNSELQCFCKLFSIDEIIITAPKLIGTAINKHNDTKMVTTMSNEVFYTDRVPCTDLVVGNGKFSIIDQIEFTILNTTTIIDIHAPLCPHSKVWFSKTGDRSFVKLNCFYNTTFKLNTENETAIPLVEAKTNGHQIHICNPNDDNFPNEIFFGYQLSEFMINLNGDTVRTEKDIHIDMDIHGTKIDQLTNLFYQSNRNIFNIDHDVVLNPSREFRNESNKPIVKLTKYSKLNLQMKHEDSIIFEKTDLNFDKSYPVFTTEKSSRRTCLQPKSTCVPINFVNVNVYGHSCTHPSQALECEKRSLIIFEVEDTIGACHYNKNISDIALIELREPLKNATKLLDVIDEANYHYIAVMIGKLISSIHSIWYMFDFGNSIFLLSSIAENQEPDPLKWSITAKMIAASSRSVTLGSSCRNSRWNINIIGGIALLLNLLIFVPLSMIYFKSRLHADQKAKLQENTGYIKLEDETTDESTNTSSGMIIYGVNHILLYLSLYLSFYFIPVFIQVIWDVISRSIIIGILITLIISLFIIHGFLNINLKKKQMILIDVPKIIFILGNFLLNIMVSFTLTFTEFNHFAFSISYLVLMNVFKLIQLIYLIFPITSRLKKLGLTVFVLFKLTLGFVICLVDIVSIVFASLYIGNPFMTNITYILIAWIASFISGLLMMCLYSSNFIVDSINQLISTQFDDEINATKDEKETPKDPEKKPLVVKNKEVPETPKTPEKEPILIKKPERLDEPEELLLKYLDECDEKELSDAGMLKNELEDILKKNTNSWTPDEKQMRDRFVGFWKEKVENKTK